MCIYIYVYIYHMESHNPVMFQSPPSQLKDVAVLKSIFVGTEPSFWSPSRPSGPLSHGESRPNWRCLDAAPDLARFPIDLTWKSKMLISDDQ